MPTIPQVPGIYNITCHVNGKHYIGSTTNLRKRWYWHRGDLQQGRHHNRHLQFAWLKYGPDAFTYDILEYVSDVECLHEREQYWMDLYQSHDHTKGYNHGPAARAPFLGKSLDEAHKQKLSERHKGRPANPRSLEAAAEWHKSEEGRAWHREHAKRVAATIQHIEKICAYCEQVYLTKDKRDIARFCSQACKAKAYRRTFKPAICVGCGAEYQKAKLDGRSHCTLSCAAKCRSRREDGTFD